MRLFAILGLATRLFATVQKTEGCSVDINKMDSDRIIESVRLLRKMGLQAIICTPPDKVSDIMPIADRTLLVNKDKYRMHILPFGKEIAQ